MTQEDRRKWIGRLLEDIGECQGELGLIEHRLKNGETPSLAMLMQRVGTLQGHMAVFRHEQREER